MMPAPWLSSTGALVMLALAALCAARLVLGVLRRTRLQWDTELLHLAMAAAMAGMLESRTAVLPGSVWLVLFAAGGAWFGWRWAAAARRSLTRQTVGHGLVHVGGCAAMVYMFLVAPPATGAPAMADLICGARMLGMPSTGGGSVATPWALVALGLGGILLAGAACLPRVGLRPPAPPAAMALSVRASGARPGNGPPADSARLSYLATRATLGAQIAMCLTMTVMLVAMYR
jgi:hypothetical protein